MKVVKAIDYVIKLFTKNDLKRILLTLQNKALRLENATAEVSSVIFVLSL